MSTDPKTLRRYQAGVERALSLFDVKNEWADYIAFLSRLLKALQASPPDASIPQKQTLAKYLAQCLKPALPSGVHQKVLEVYNQVFSLLDTDGLSRDLPLYLPGLSNTLTFASLSTRPLFLGLFDEYILKLPTRVLRPALKAIILSLLPGLEEENSEDFDYNIHIFDNVRRIFAEDGLEEIFWQNLFLASITSSSRRAGALVYLYRHMPRLQMTPMTSSGLKTMAVDESEDTSARIQVVTHPEPGLLIRCFATGLQDEQPLVQRAFLDLLVTHLPLSAPALQNLVSSVDLDVLVTAAMSVVLRRDMSLNRRLWTWFTGTDDKKDGHVKSPSETILNGTLKFSSGNNHKELTRIQSYFTKFGLASAVRSVEKMVSQPHPPASERARPFRILLSLMDRWEVGGPIVDANLVELLRDLQQYQTTAPSQEAFDEVFRSASVFFDGIESRLVASKLFQLLDNLDLDVMEFIVANFNLQEEETVTIHLPLICSIIFHRLSDGKTSKDSVVIPPLDLKTRVRLIGLLGHFLNTIPAKDVTNASEKSLGHTVPDRWLEELRAYYTFEASLTQKITSPPLQIDSDDLLIRNMAEALFWHIQSQKDNALMELFSIIAESTLHRVASIRSLQHSNIMQRLHEIASASSCDINGCYSLAKCITKLMHSVQDRDPGALIISTKQILQITPVLVKDFWQALSPATPQYHVEAVEFIWMIRSMCGTLPVVDSTIAKLAMPSADSRILSGENRPLEQFANFWNLSRLGERTAQAPSSISQLDTQDTVKLLKTPILNIIDAMDIAAADEPCRGWLVTLPSLKPMFSFVLEEWTIDVLDDQLGTLTFGRLLKLINLARQSPSQWKDFQGTEGQAELILDLCIKIISDENVKIMYAIPALSIIRIVSEGRSDPVYEKLVQILVELMQLARHHKDLQSELLDTLQVMVSSSSATMPPTHLLTALVVGLREQDEHTNMDKWIRLLCNVVPVFPTTVFFANLLKMTEAFCSQIKFYSQVLQRLFTRDSPAIPSPEAEPSRGPHGNPERSMANMLAGLEYILARAHAQVSERPTSRPQSSAGSGAETAHLRNFANNRLAVILCMQDAIKVCGDVWCWWSSNRTSADMHEAKSFQHLSARLRTRTRRILEHLIDAEPQESLETLMGMWAASDKDERQADQMLDLLQSLDGARPKYMMPATFNAIDGRTNPTGLDSSQKSSLSVDISGAQLVDFLIQYISALEDDLIEEIWKDCMTFLREVLGNPMPRRQILLKLLDLVALLCTKMENTNFGEQNRMRKEIADLSSRLFTSIFTIKPAGLEAGAADAVTSSEKSAEVPKSTKGETRSATQIICETLPQMNSVLTESDRITSVVTGILTYMVGPTLKSKNFPQNMNADTMTLLNLIAKSPGNNRTWKKDVIDAFNEPRFFQTPASLVISGWLPLIRHLTQSDKTLMPDLLTRLTPPTTAGLMFGVGATAARNEADRRTQLTVRRIILLLLANDIDIFVPNLAQILAKIEELLPATPASSPSSSTRGDLYILLRAIVLTFSPAQLVSVWPIIDSELRDLFADMIETDPDAQIYTKNGHLQGAKLLDLLLLLKPEEFQLHEWLYVTDTVDAIYPTDSAVPMALADQLATKDSQSEVRYPELPTPVDTDLRRPWLCTELTRTAGDPVTVFTPFFNHLSIHAFEDIYSLQKVDMEACRGDLVADLCVD